MSADLERMIRNLARSGNLNHISLSMDKDGKAWCAIFRDTIGMAPYRYVTDADPVAALTKALSSVGFAHGGDEASPDKAIKAAKRKPAAASARRDDSELLGSAADVAEWQEDSALVQRRRRDDDI